MKLPRYLLTLMLLSSTMLFYVGDSYASEKMTVRLAVEDSWPPFAKSDGTGISRSIVEKAFAQTKTDVEFLVVPYARALRMAEIGQVDGAFNVAKQNSTTGKFLFGKEPLLQTQASYYYRPDNILNFNDPSEIPNHTVVGVILGYEYGNMYENNRQRFNEVRVSNQKQIIRLLIERKIDVAIMYDEIARYMLKEMNLPPSKITKGELNHVSDIYVAFSKNTPDVEKKIELLDRGIRALNQLKMSQ